VAVDPGGGARPQPPAKGPEAGGACSQPPAKGAAAQGRSPRERERERSGVLRDSVRSRPVDCDISFGSPVEAEAQQDRPMSQ